MISIAERLRPFSHQPGTRCLIPGTDRSVEVFPALIRIGKQEIPLEVKGPLSHFMVIQDLERGCVTVRGGPLFYHILPGGKVVTTKHPHLPPLPTRERLSLGSHKKQEWEGIRRRCDFREIFPLWFRLGNLTPKLPLRREKRGVFALLDNCWDAVASRRPETLFPAFKKVFLAGFGGMLVPRARDEEHQGILATNEPVETSPLHLLLEGAALIRSLFLLADGETMQILPNLPPECFAGRMLSLTVPLGELDLEWTKKTIRRVVFRAQATGLAHFRFQSGIKTFRLRETLRERGKRVSCSEPLEIKSGALYLLDNFQK